jgi:hypothetical protein
MNASEVLRGADDCDRWSRVFMLLSLPRLGRFLPEMGLPQDVRLNLREIAEECRRELEAAGGSDRLERSREILDGALRRIATSDGEGAADAFVSWVEEAFPREPSRTAQPFLWTQVLRRFAVTAALAESGISPPKQQVIAEAIKRNVAATATLGARVRESEKEAKTPWEERVYAAYPEDCSPLDYVEDVVLRMSFRTTWQIISGTLDGGEKKALLAWARGKASAMGMPSELLAYPD